MFEMQLAQPDQAQVGEVWIVLGMIALMNREK
jgi:hypothetical protein